MPECSFCKKDYSIPRGLTFVLHSGDIMYFCSSKCRKNFNLRRKSEKVNWIRKAKNSETLHTAEAEEKED